MIFRDYLQEILDNVDGAIAATLMADDGIPIADLVLPQNVNLDIKTVAIEFSKLLKDAEHITQGLAIGQVEELLVNTEQYAALFLPVTTGYFLVLLLNRNGNLGKGRYLLKQYRPKIIAQL